ncbi:MAG TPA: hypothetical protein VE818_06535 [Nitrososphaeraceae archaeon]|nr:hypothetical protein [Nitrososphaeraceae archaeon]
MNLALYRLISNIDFSIMISLILLFPYMPLCSNALANEKEDDGGKDNYNVRLDQEE